MVWFFVILFNFKKNCTAAKLKSLTNNKVFYLNTIVLLQLPMRFWKFVTFASYRAKRASKSWIKHRAVRVHCEIFYLFQVVAFFLTSSSDQEAITKALGILKKWNPDMSPKYGMTDCDMAEINALAAVFPGCKCFVCDFHVKQAWTTRIKSILAESHGQGLFCTFFNTIAIFYNLKWD